MLIQQLPDGPLDIVGDVRGKLAEFHALFETMEYSADGDHPECYLLI